jgi:hypothetical protein
MSYLQGRGDRILFLFKPCLELSRLPFLKQLWGDIDNPEHCERGRVSRKGLSGVFAQSVRVPTLPLVSCPTGDERSAIRGAIQLFWRKRELPIFKTGSKMLATEFWFDVIGKVTFMHTDQPFPRALLGIMVFFVRLSSSDAKALTETFHNSRHGFSISLPGGMDN